MKTQYTLLQKEIDPSLTILFKETNPHHPEIISDGNGFAIVIEDWEKGIYRFVNSAEESGNIHNVHFTPNNAQPILKIKDLNNLWRTITGNQLIYIGKQKSPKKETNYKKDKTGEIHRTNSYGEVEIIEQFSSKNMTIKFLEDDTILKNQKYGAISRGCIRNPSKKFYYGKGYIGMGVYDGSHKGFKRWQNMLQRSYDIKYHEKFPTYIGVEVSEEWHCFQNFAEWYDVNFKDYMNSKWHLDKDLLSKSSKIYSPQTCCFLPDDINRLLIFLNKNTGLVINSNGDYYSKTTIKGEPLWLGKSDSEQEAFNKVMKVKIEYAERLLFKYDNLLSENALEELTNLIENKKS